MQDQILYVSEAKRQAETISYFGDFRDVLTTGETITSHAVTVTCISGIDPNPSAMLYGGVDVDDNATVIEQRIEQGVVGALYDILFTVDTSAGNTYQKFTRLAILPNNLTTEQLHITIRLTSWNYPYNAGDDIQGYIGFAGGSNFWLQPYFSDDIQSNVVILNGNLFGSLLTYACPPESIQGSTSITSGVLTQVVIPYTTLPETIQGNVAITSGNLFQGKVYYTTTPETIQGDSSIISGLLF